MDQVMKEMIASEIISPASVTSGFLSPMFSVLKPNGSLRPIFNLKRLNSYLKTKKFRLINHLSIPDFLQSNDFMVSIDLSQAYCHVPVLSRHRRFLSLVYRDRVYSWNCLPFGLASAPQAFAQLTNWVAQFLRDKGLRVVVYLDDFLLAHQCAIVLRAQAAYAIQILNFLGWTPNLQKSRTIPSQAVKFLGIMWNTVSNLVSLPPESIRSLSQRLRSLLCRPIWSLKSAQSLIGSLNFAAFAIPLGRLHLRRIQLAHRRLSRLNPRLLRPIPPRALQEIRWWLENLVQSAPLHPPIRRIFVSTDASNWGWGATISGVHLSQKWTKEQELWHINRKELYGVRAVILRNQGLLTNHSLILQSDNQTVCAYIRKQGGLRSASLLLETEKLLNLSHSLNITIKPFFIPGVLNTLADRLSRQSSLPDWHLKPSITSKIFQRWGTPEIDLFASSRSKVTPNYVSIHPEDVHAAFIDAFSRPWNFNLAWVFPPPPLIPQVLHFLNQASGSYLLVVPRWKKVFWRADLKARASAPPWVIRNLRAHLVDLSTNYPPPLVDELVLEVWRIRGGVGSSRAGLIRTRPCF
uniref:Polyprotein P3 n=1 Tax=Cacopsylla melanoneura TaxID=428564 RepID=A0A8D8SW92_9HEMI